MQSETVTLKKKKREHRGLFGSRDVTWMSQRSGCESGVKRRGRLTFSDVPDKPRNVSVSRTRAKNENARTGRVGKVEFFQRATRSWGGVSEENSHPGTCGQVVLVTRQPLWANLSAVLVNHVTEAQGYLTPVCER